MKTDLKQSLNRAVDQLPHPSFRDIADPPVIKMETMDRFAAQEEKSRRKDWKQFYRYAVPVFLCLLLLLPGFGYVRSNLLVDGIIDLDVNPSIEITINRRDRVLQVTGLNEEAVEILAGTDYRTWDVRDAVGDLILRLNDKQYISRNQRTVLLSVDSKNPEKAERIKQELSASIEAALAGTEIQPLVVRQSRPKDRDLQKRANEYHISSGKMRLVEEAARKAPDRDERELAGTAVDELYRLLRNGGGGRPDWLETDRDADWDSDDQDGDDDDQDRDEEGAGRDDAGRDDDDRDDDDRDDDDRDDADRADADRDDDDRDDDQNDDDGRIDDDRDSDGDSEKKSPGKAERKDSDDSDRRGHDSGSDDGDEDDDKDDDKDGKRAVNGQGNHRETNPTGKNDSADDRDDDHDDDDSDHDGGPDDDRSQNDGREDDDDRDDDNGGGKDDDGDEDGDDGDSGEDDD
ncbi:hypothetical protein [Enterocloster lavalensis]|uniref:anti-sigma-I factor RsgI family protein n=1 Tax=Enterocloster lavalensis TaxID=460384 RepID=UPI001D061B8B|nr:hypothetical protein [Enterocloster lavalensis]MCB6343009.1 hypothetical protein [Enterocloster lavalensis]